MTADPSTLADQARPPDTITTPEGHPLQAPGSSRFTKRRVVVMRHRGNLANKMLQYMGALTLASRIDNCDIVNVDIPEWNINIPDDTQEQIFFDNIDMWTWDPFVPNIVELMAIANNSESVRLMMADHLLRMEFLLDSIFYRKFFPVTTKQPYEFTEKDLVINIRTAEILSGFAPHYPICLSHFTRI